MNFAIYVVYIVDVVDKSLNCCLLCPSLFAIFHKKTDNFVSRMLKASKQLCSVGGVPVCTVRRVSRASMRANCVSSLLTPRGNKKKTQIRLNRNVHPLLNILSGQSDEQATEKFPSFLCSVYYLHA